MTLKPMNMWKEVVEQTYNLNLSDLFSHVYFTAKVIKNIISQQCSLSKDMYLWNVLYLFDETN